MAGSAPSADVPASGTSPAVTARELVEVRAVSDALGRCRFPRAGTAVSCGVSGGADSSALVVLAVAAGLDVTAIHVDHGLRPGSAAEADRVRSMAARFGARFDSRTATVEAGPNLEARARGARRAALPPDCLLGHTADDQAETVLLSLLRGAGLDGLAGIRPERHPLLGVRRSETEAICTAFGIDWLEDPSNADPAFRRNRVRHELLPLLASISDRDPVPLLVRSAALVGDDRDLLDHLAGGIDATDARALARAPRPLARRAVRAWLRESLPERHPPDAAGVERVLAVADGSIAATQVAGGISVRRSGQRLFVDP